MGGIFIFQRIYNIQFCSFRNSLYYVLETSIIALGLYKKSSYVIKAKHSKHTGPLTKHIII